MIKQCKQKGCSKPKESKALGQARAGAYCGICRLMRKRAKKDGVNPDDLDWVELDKRYFKLNPPWKEVAEVKNESN